MFKDKKNILAFFFFSCSSSHFFFFLVFSSELFIINLSLESRELGLCCVGAEFERVGEVNDTEV